MGKMKLWKRLGNVAEGRKTLGEDMPVLVYRLFQYAIKDVLDEEYGAEKASKIFKDAGRLAGIEFAENTLQLEVDFDFFIINLTETLKDLKIGHLHIEKSDLEKMHFVLTVSEDLDCSGLPVTDETICDYDEGFIAGILERYTGKPFEVKEVDCWASGDRTCRFEAKLLKED
jgi:predicted hydrocarbon binding protein